MKLVIRTREMLEKGKPNQKSELNRLALSLGTELASGEHSIEHLQRSTQYLRALPNSPFLDRFDLLAKECNAETGPFTCLLRVPAHSPIKPFVENFSGVLKLKNDRPDKPTSEQKLFFDQVGPKDLVVEVTIRTVDRHAARTQAEDWLLKISGLIALFKPEPGPSLKSDYVLVRKKEEVESAVKAEMMRRKHVYGQAVVRDFLSRFTEFKMQNDQLLRFIASAEYHQIAISAHSDEVRLVNLWTALETLVANEGAALDRLCDWVPPSMALRNAQKYLWALSRYIRAYWRRHGFGAFRSIFPNSTESELKPTDLYDVLVLDGDAKPLVDLCNALDHPLMRYRLFKLHKFFREPKEVVGAARRHAQNVDWQLRRIYRARNQIAHEGTTPLALRNLVDHLHTYYIQTVRGLVEDAGIFHFARISDCFQHRKLMWQMFQKAQLVGREMRDWVMRPVTLYQS